MSDRDYRTGPDFLCVGQQKAGTGWLYDQLQAHPGAWVPPIKELNFFYGKPFRKKYLDWLAAYEKETAPVWRHPVWKLKRALLGGSVEANGPGRMLSEKHPELDARFWKLYRQGSRHPEPGIDWYRSLFPSQSGLVSGDITPGYSRLSPEAIAEIKQAFPGIKAVLLIRDPVSRAKSGISMSIRKGRLKAGDQNDPEKIRKYLERPSRQERAYPSKIWENWRDGLGSNNTRYWFFEDIRDNAGETRNGIFEFLGLDNGVDNLSADFNRKSKRKKSVFSDEVTSTIRNFYADEIDRCAKVFGSHAENW
jgi:hypothetical protein